MKWLQKYHADFLNGEGLREVIFLSGCPHHCKGCFNKESWDSSQGKEWTDKDKQELIEELNKSYISGVTFTGGDPLWTLDINLIKELKELGFNIWVYTGYTFEYIQNNHDLSKFLSYIDVLCDGPFIEFLHKNNIKKWVGSSNQRVIDVQKSLKEKRIIEIDDLYKKENINGKPKIDCFN